MGRSRAAKILQPFSSALHTSHRDMARTIAQANLKLDFLPPDSNPEVSRVLSRSTSSADLRQTYRNALADIDLRNRGLTKTPETERYPIVKVTDWGRLSIHHTAGHFTVNAVVRSDQDGISATVTVIETNLNRGLMKIGNRLSEMGTMAMKAAAEIIDRLPKPER